MLKADVQIIPNVVSRTGTVNVRTLAEITQLVILKEELPNIVAIKQLPTTTKKIAMALHIHAQEWLSYTTKNSRKKPSSQRQRSLLTHKAHYKSL